MGEMAFCSAVTLCFASIFSLVSAALLAIAFSTDNWQTIIVQREALKQEAERTNNEAILNNFDRSPLYYPVLEAFSGNVSMGRRPKLPSWEMICPCLRLRHGAIISITTFPMTPEKPRTFPRKT